MNTDISSLAYFSECVLLFSDEECEQFPNIKSSASGFFLAFPYFFANFNLVLLIKKRVHRSAQV